MYLGAFWVSSSLETGRTPGSDAGCNKPAGRSVEQTVEVVRAHEDGTCGAVGIASPKELALVISGSGHRQERRWRGTPGA